MVVAELLSKGAPAVLVLLVLHLISTPELSSSEARLSEEHWWMMYCIYFNVAWSQVYDYVEFFSGAGKVSATLSCAQTLAHGAFIYL